MYSWPIPFPYGTPAPFHWPRPNCPPSSVAALFMRRQLPAVTLCRLHRFRRGFFAARLTLKPYAATFHPHHGCGLGTGDSCRLSARSVPLPVVAAWSPFPAQSNCVCCLPSFRLPLKRRLHTRRRLLVKLTRRPGGIAAHWAASVQSAAGLSTNPK